MWFHVEQKPKWISHFTVWVSEHNVFVVCTTFNSFDSWDMCSLWLKSKAFKFNNLCLLAVVLLFGCNFCWLDKNRLYQYHCFIVVIISNTNNNIIENKKLKSPTRPFDSIQARCFEEAIDQMSCQNVKKMNINRNTILLIIWKEGTNIFTSLSIEYADLTENIYFKTRSSALIHSEKKKMKKKCDQRSHDIFEMFTVRNSIHIFCNIHRLPFGIRRFGFVSARVFNILFGSATQKRQANSFINTFIHYYYTTCFARVDSNHSFFLFLTKSRSSKISWFMIYWCPKHAHFPSVLIWNA